MSQISSKKIPNPKDVAYSMLSTIFDYDTVSLQSETFRVKVFPDAVYRGEFMEGRRHGWGVMVYS